MIDKRPRPDNPFPTRPEDVLNKGIRASVGALPERWRANVSTIGNC
ncbi:hypothetical protein SAMN05444171_0298 [Bradyrhizobium lablabi]|jgi:hypothetical protein|uniref:Uncharacterized protein n=2 Tax=Bradyrhizobium TaxID=374 RepID=A0ABY0QDA8_9BRAD|nr:hypothetical protein SAMN05444163_6859 [Bradyrhizobium ottawaense]SEB94886.1 hypothetical protein SAMN05444171_0298 [Bradyrhizobium lablabi]SHM64737.1 hypothetical protein SAMN05444321_7077 [Bradyrhizobium lablabi]